MRRNVIFFTSLIILVVSWWTMKFVLSSWWWLLPNIILGWWMLPQLIGSFIYEYSQMWIIEKVKIKDPLIGVCYPYQEIYRFAKVLFVITVITGIFVLIATIINWHFWIQFYAIILQMAIQIHFIRDFGFRFFMRNMRKKNPNVEVLEYIDLFHKEVLDKV
jgi:hypothetical protein